MLIFSTAGQSKIMELNKMWSLKSLAILGSINKKVLSCLAEFFTFINVYIFYIEQDKILISQLSPPKFRYIADQNRPKRGPHENEF